jgi:arsenite methyltransferase
VLKPVGRLAISDVVALRPIPEALSRDVGAIAGCVAAAASPETIRTLLVSAGFHHVRINIEEESREFISGWLPGVGVETYVASATIEATKPAGKSCCAPDCCTPEGGP